MVAGLLTTMQDRERSCKPMLARVWFVEEERSKQGFRTGRIRNAVSHLLCEYCGHKEAVDDSLDGPWIVRPMTK